MHRTRIVIPTYKRLMKQLTLRNLPRTLHDRVTLVASEVKEAEFLEATYPYVQTVFAAPARTGIAAKRDWIMRAVREIEAEKIIMLDDDLDFYCRSPIEDREYKEGRWRPRSNIPILAKSFATPEVIHGWFAAWAKRLDDLAHVGLSSRMGNDTQEEEVLFVGRAMHAIGFRRAEYLNLGLDFGAVRFREDFHVTLELLKRGYPNEILYSMCCAPGPYGASGGASTERTTDDSNTEAYRLADLHPEFVDVVDKDYDNLPRKEVRVQWKKAYEHGRASQR